MDVADSLSFGETQISEPKPKSSKKEMPRKIVRKDFKLNEIKVLKNSNTGSAAYFGGDG